MNIDKKKTYHISFVRNEKIIEPICDVKDQYLQNFLVTLSIHNMQYTIYISCLNNVIDKNKSYCLIKPSG